MKGTFDVKLLGSSNWMRFLSFLMLSAVAAIVGVLVHVGNQAETDQRNLESIGEQQVLSQRIAKYALAASTGDSAAFDGLALTKERFVRILAAQRAEFISGAAVKGGPLVEAFLAFETSWDGISRDIETVINGKEQLLAVAGTAKVMSEVMPPLLESAEEVVRLMVANGASASQVSLASRLSLLGQRIVNNIKQVMTGEDAESAVMAFVKDNAEFESDINGMMHGQGGIQAVSDKTVQSKLRQIETLFKRLSGHVGAVAENTKKLVSAQAAAKSVSLQGERLLESTDQFKDAYVVTEDSRIISMELAYLLGAVALFVLFWMGFETLRSQKRRNRVVEDENSRNQEAIMRLLDEMGDLAEGDLTVRATVSEDFTGSIADSINVTVDSLRGLVKTINVTSRQLSGAVHETEEIAQQLSRASEKQSNDIANTSSAINAMTDSLDEVSDNASESSKVAMRSVEIAKNGGNAVKRTMEGMGTIREHIQETSKRIKRLGESSQEIGDIVELINDIAEQTNILALNASIQAAMAGEAGRGFAVVADEVQRLAERSANATKQIEALVKAIQADTNEAVISMEKSTSGVVNGTRLAEDAGGALEEIESVSEQLAGLIQTISGAARQQAAAAAEISKTMSGIQDVTTQTAAGTERTAQSIGNLARLAQDLDKSVAGFKLPQ
jgi:twitching motility protein PilJ